MDDYDFIFVGSGINALVGASLLGKKGRKILVLERADHIGGCLRTETITLPGFVHDVMATTMVLFLTSPAYAALGKDLEARGLELCHTDTPTGVVRPDGSYAIFSMQRSQNVSMFDNLSTGDGQAFASEMDKLASHAPFLFSLLGGAVWSRGTVGLLAKQAWKLGLRPLAEWFGDALEPARGYLETTYRSELIHALWAPWVLHCGLNPENASAAQMLKVIGFAIESAGCPIAKGGAHSLVQAFQTLILDQDGEVRTGADVKQIVRGPGGRAGGVELTDGRIFTAKQGVICSTTPTQLYDRLLSGWEDLPPKAAREVRRFRYGKGNMQIHYALSEPPRWKANPDLAKVALLHLTPGLDGVSRACNECERGMLPAEPSICVGQPVHLDPSRAPAGQSILWLQLPETPRAIKGDAAGEITVAPDGGWTEETRERYADRVEAILARQIEGFETIKLARKVYSPADLEQMNINLVGGDPYGGSATIDQFFLWRPFKSSVNHKTPIPGLYHIGASTHPGAGLSGGSGYLLASALK